MVDPTNSTDTRGLEIMEITQSIDLFSVAVADTAIRVLLIGGIATTVWLSIKAILRAVRMHRAGW